ncbi:MAG: hypothetical protein AABY22_08955 [Nanoarchaeota archaeon]
MSHYRAEVTRAMEYLADDPRTIFLGQTVGYPGSRFTYGTLQNIPIEKRIELPIMEEIQMGMSTGLALGGYIPISIYPRFDFLLLAQNQLVNHLDKLEQMSQGEFKPKVIIKTIVGSRSPLDPGPQHYQDHTEAFRKLLTNIDVIKLEREEDVFSSYVAALNSDRSSLLIELGELH